MKKTLLFASLLIMFASSGCSKNEIIDINKKTDEINFNAYVKTSTKAEIKSNDNFNDFTLFCYKTEDLYSGTGNLNPYFTDLNINRTDKTKPWTHEEKYFWPINNEKLQFFAISPYDTNTNFLNTPEESYPFMYYFIENFSENQKDIIASTIQNKTKSSDDNTINFSFKHILSKINFSVKGEKEGYEYNIKSIELINIKNSGKFTFDDNLGKWSEQSGGENYHHDLTNFIFSGTTLNPINYNLILLPQTISEDAKLKVTYSVKHISTNTEIFNSFKEVSLSSTIWNINSNIRYCLSLPIGGKELKFTANVSNWNETTKDLTILELNKTNITLNEGEAETLTTNINGECVWSSSDDNIVTISNGTITAISEGSATISATINGQTAQCNVNVVGRPIYFADNNFKTAIIEQGYDRNNDNEISESEALEINLLYVNNKNISSLEGLEHFTNLKDFSCCNNSLITSINVENNPLLERLSFDFTNITSINLNKNILLKQIYCSNTKITTIDISKNTILEELYCYLNDITSLNTDNNPNLKIISCGNTKISSLNLTNNTKITYVDCSRTNINSLNIEKSTELTKLDCGSTNISTLDISNNLKLKELSIYDTDISTIDVSKHIELENLTCHDTNISSLDVSKNLKLNFLTITNLKIASINLSQNTKLKDFMSDNTNITSLDLSKNIELETLSFSNSKINTLDLSKNTKLKSLYCYSTAITSLDLRQNPLLETLYINSCIELSNSGLETTEGVLDLSNNPNLVTFECDNIPKISTIIVNPNADKANWSYYENKIITVK